MLGLAKLEYKIRPYLIRYCPPKFSTFIYSFFRAKYFKELQVLLKSPVYIPKKEIVFANLKFRNSLGNAAGFDKDGKLLFLNYFLGAGFGLVGTTLPSPYQGNKKSFYGKKLNPWVPLPKSEGALNSLGLPSLGINLALDNIKKFRDKIDDPTFPIGLSISGHPLEKNKAKLENVLKMASLAASEVDFFEINESCPNLVHNDNSLKERLSKLAKLQKSIKKSFFIKLSKINESMIDFLEEQNFSGITLTNTQKNYSQFKNFIHKNDLKAFSYYTKNYQGGLSGQIISNYSLKTLKEAHKIIQNKAYKLKLIHCGGIFTKEQKRESAKISPISQWYSGLMKALNTMKLKNIYK